MANKHLIGKQVLNVEMSPSGNSYALQQRFSEMVWKELSPQLSDLFDRFVGENEMLRLDKIELDLGEITMDTSNNAIIKKIIDLLEEELNRHKALLTLKTGANFTQGFKNAGYTARDYIFQLWIHWLGTGTLPPYTLHPQENWMPQVLETLALEHRAVSQLQDTLIKSTHALNRLVLQNKQNDLKSIVELFTGYSQTALLNLIDKFQDNLAKETAVMEISPREFEIKIWSLILKEVIIEGKKSDSKTILRVISENIRADIKSLLKEMSKDEVEKGNQERNEIGKEVAKEEMETPQFFKNAGMILLHPFYNRLFQKLKLMEGKKFKNFFSQSKAILLMQFLATGQENLPEYEMILPKFLCGMPANLPMDHTIVLTKKEKTEANNLLKATIENWGALGKISPDGLREGFLIRDGKLLHQDSGWKLFVEPKALDILLDRLPWGISIVKLPWMENLLKVEWR